MSRGANQKLKLPYLMDIMLKKTDEEHGLTLPQIREELEKRGVTCERKSLYTDFADMTDHLGIEVQKEQVGRETYYRVVEREFELAEVKLLVDSIQASKFITEKKSNALIAKVKGLVSERQARQLQRQVYVHDRIKTENEEIFYNTDYLHTAIAENKKICFKYYNWDTNKKLVARNDGASYIVSPWALTWDDGNYYLVAFSDHYKQIRHYRVDKMKQIEIIEEARDGKEAFESKNIASYSSKNFSMYGGVETKVTMEFANELVGIFIDRFGKDISIFPGKDENHSKIMVDLVVSRPFFAWIFSINGDVKVTGPSEVVEEMKAAAKDFLKKYE